LWRRRTPEYLAPPSFNFWFARDPTTIGGQARRTSNSCAENRFSPVPRDQVTTVLTLRAKRIGTGTVTVRNPQPFAEVLRSPFAFVRAKCM
jgi:hypothetical protein